MTDDHLVSALRMGMRAESRRLRGVALSAFGYACSSLSNGADEAAGLACDEQLRQSFSTKALKDRLARTPRYAPLVTEVAKRNLRLSRRRPARAH